LEAIESVRLADEAASSVNIELIFRVGIAGIGGPHHRRWATIEEPEIVAGDRSDDRDVLALDESDPSNDASTFRHGLD
jgi:hypothetical protein